jgi:hypothetical protein
MSDEEFWELIAQINVKALDRGDEIAAVKPLQRALSSRTEEDLADFEEALTQKLYALDGKAYAENAGDSGFSDDGFLYARLYVVAKGREYYETVRLNPKEMPKSIEQWCEPLLYTYRHAWSVITGKEASAWPFAPSISFESGSNPALWNH